jgi:hypothetical protein
MFRASARLGEIGLRCDRAVHRSIDVDFGLPTLAGREGRDQNQAENDLFRHIILLL